MNKAIKHILMMSGGKRGYGTAGTTTTTSLASQGGLLINIDSATGDVPQTASGWIEDEKYGMYAVLSTAGFSAEFDSTVTRTGNFTVKVSTTDATGRGYVTNSGGSVTSLGLQRLFIKVKPSTKYRTGCWIKTTNANTVFFRIQGYSITLGGGTNYDTATVTGTTDWTYYTTTFTTGGTIEYARFALYNNIAGNISDAWFDVNSMTLEEVIEPVANSLVTPSPSLVSFTAVGSTDNIDQSQLTNTASNGVGYSGAELYWGQAFTPTKSKLTGVTLIKTASVGTPTTTVTFAICSDNAGSPGSTIYATNTVSSATWNALADNSEFTVNLPCNLTAGTQYWIRYNTSGTDTLNYRTVGRSTSGVLCKYSADAVTWALPGAARTLYFKTLYYKPTTNFKASQNNQSVSISADEDGFLNGSVINFLTGAYSWNSGLGLSNYLDSLHSAFFRTDSYWNPTTGNRIISGTGSATLIYRLPAGLTSLILNFVSTVAGGSTLEISSSIDNISYTVNSTGLFSDTCTLIDGARYIKLRALGSNCKLETLTVTGTVDVSSYSRLKNYPTNKDIIKQYATTLGAPTTSATYRATKWGFPAIEYSATEYQYLDVDTTATGSTVAFSELGTTYTTVADGASLAISSTSTPNLFVKANITANRLYSSSNDFNASSDKDGSLRQNITYQVVQ